MNASATPATLREIFERYRATRYDDEQSREALTATFSEQGRALLDSAGLVDETYEAQIRGLYELCGRNIDSELVAETVGCSIQYARRFSYSDSDGAYEKEWSRATQREKVSPGRRDRIIDRDGDACVRCGAQSPLEVHHIRPVRSGGENVDSNLATLCTACHRAAHDGSKSSGETAYDDGAFDTWLDCFDGETSESSDSGARQSHLTEFGLDVE